MADYRQDAICKKCGFEYSYFGGGGCPRCPRLEKEAKIEKYVESVKQAYRNDPERTVADLAEQLARKIF